MGIESSSFPGTPRTPPWLDSLGSYIVREGDPNVLGEILRELTFVGEGFGCYSTFDVRSGATKWTYNDRLEFWLRYAASGDPDEVETASDEARMGEGYTFELFGYTVHVVWYWDGDGMLCFIVEREGTPLRAVSNGDCKKSYGWRDDYEARRVPGVREGCPLAKEEKTSSPSSSSSGLLGEKGEPR